MRSLRPGIWKGKMNVSCEGCYCKTANTQFVLGSVQLGLELNWESAPAWKRNRKILLLLHTGKQSQKPLLRLQKGGGKLPLEQWKREIMKTKLRGGTPSLILCWIRGIQAPGGAQTEGAPHRTFSVHCFRCFTDRLQYFPVSQLCSSASPTTCWALFTQQSNFIKNSA